MSRAQRLTFLAIAVVIAVVAVVVLAGAEDEGSGDAGEQAAATATASATPESPEASPQETATPTPEPTPEPPPLLRSGRVAELAFSEGETIRFRVRSDTDEEIHVHAYDIEREVPAGKTITVAFKATITGIIEVEFHGSGEQIAELTIEPR